MYIAVDDWIDAWKRVYLQSLNVVELSEILHHFGSVLPGPFVAIQLDLFQLSEASDLRDIAQALLEMSLSYGSGVSTPSTLYGKF